MDKVSQQESWFILFFDSCNEPDPVLGSCRVNVDKNRTVGEVGTRKRGRHGLRGKRTEGQTEKGTEGSGGGPPRVGDMGDERSEMCGESPRCR